MQPLLGRLTRALRNRRFIQSLRHIALYALWLLFFRLICLTLLTYILSTGQAKFEEISDAYTSNEATLMGFGSLIYLFLVWAMTPVPASLKLEFASWPALKRSFPLGFTQGLSLALSFAIALALGDLYRYVGVYLSLEGASLALLSLFLRIFALVSMVYFEEFLFRGRLLLAAREHFSFGFSLVATSLFYIGIKFIQFDLTAADAITLFLFSLLLGFRTHQTGGFVQGAAFLFGFLLMIHPLLSMPLFGAEFHGVFLLKLQSDLSLGRDSALNQLLSGGEQGPLASLALQVLLFVTLVLWWLRRQKVLSTPTR